SPAKRRRRGAALGDLPQAKSAIAAKAISAISARIRLSEYGRERPSARRRRRGLCRAREEQPSAGNGPSRRRSKVPPLEIEGHVRDPVARARSRTILRS